ncbi:MAG: ChaN family lipoprotein [Candidatus Krumholzibacteriota bacterium]|nr:ChaN family lipoprotein [Candidatus Krumholzibacteriota bacterium]
MVLEKSFLAGTILLAAVLLFSGCGGDDLIDPPAISAELQKEMENWFAANGRAPGDYVSGLFNDHDVVLLGEMHRFKHDELFVQKLIPRLHAEGVNLLATEFARRTDQALLDSLVLASRWDEDLGREILFEGFMPWGFREYLDIFRTAWKVNSERPAGRPPFRVIGVNNTLKYEHFKSEADWNDPEVWKLVAGDQTEADWALPVIEAVRSGEKVLVHCGIHHAFTGFRQPVVVDGRFERFSQGRFGNHIREAIGERAVTVALHAPWSSAAGYNSEYVHPANGRIDAFMLSRGGGPFEMGFDVAGSPLGDLPIGNAVYGHGYDPFTLSTFCDGYIYTKPVSRYEPVTYIEGWINDSNLERAHAVAMNPLWREFSVEQLNAGCKSYMEDHKKFYGRLR